MNTDHSQVLQQQVQDAFERGAALKIVGGNTKTFYARQIEGEVLSTSSHSGIISYEPTELVITARAGTLLQELTNTLDEKHQMLGFEPPAFGELASLGGTVACNFSGPRRAYMGAARDFVLGCRIINGKGDILSFGGEVMKNVAGYDVSRLMAGAMGTLGVLLEISLKVLPKPEREVTQVLECDAPSALEKMHSWARQPLPISATCFADGQLLVRLSGSVNAVDVAAKRLGGDTLAGGREFWRLLREQQLAFFKTDQPIWRLSLASDAPPLSIEGDQLYEWGGALRWIRTSAGAEVVRSSASEFGGHASVFRNASIEADVFHPLSAGLVQIHKNLKQAFDPGGILNPGRMYPGL
ncbi:MAG: glycolate oxidase subunit GlcE [Gammaproteobacteria bacterium]|nr:glycolate oxidase subunit GlcE [Gammaproteobacteria bacterium]